LSVGNRQSAKALIRIKACAGFWDDNPAMHSITFSNSITESRAVRRDARAAVAPRASVFLPKEHGSWSLALEPLALGLLLAPSLSGGALAVAAFAGFLLRRPWKAAFAAASVDSGRAAREAAVLLIILVIAGGFETLVLGNPAALWPVLLAVPGGLLFAYFDAQGEGRAAAAELSGSAAFAILPAALATLAGWPVLAALGLATLALARSIPTILTVRTFLRKRKGEPTDVTLPVLVACAAVATVLLFALTRSLSWLAVAAPALLLLRAIWFASPWRPAWTAKRVGMMEAVLGVAYLVIATLAQPPIAP